MLSVPETVPARPLGAFRVVVGLVAVVKSLEFFVNPFIGTRPRPLYHFLPALPTAVWTTAAVIMLTASLLLVVGWQARAAALVIGLLVFSFIWGAGYYSNHIYLIAVLTLLLSFTECDAALSIRQWSGLDQDQVWGPPVYLIRAQISVVYFYAAVGKINADFLLGNALASWGFRSTLAPHVMLIMPVLVVMAVGAVATELFVAVALWVRHVRPVAIVLGIILHLSMISYLSNSVLAVVELSLFAAMMVGGYLLFLDQLPGPLDRRMTSASSRATRVEAS